MRRVFSKCLVGEEEEEEEEEECWRKEGKCRVEKWKVSTVNN